MQRVGQRWEGQQSESHGELLRRNRAGLRSNPRGAVLAIAAVALFACSEDEVVAPLPLPEEPSDDVRLDRKSVV